MFIFNHTTYICLGPTFLYKYFEILKCDEFKNVNGKVFEREEKKLILENITKLCYDLAFFGKVLTRRKTVYIFINCLSDAKLKVHCSVI